MLFRSVTTRAGVVKSVDGKSGLSVMEILRNNGFDVLANGAAGLAKRIADEVPKWRDLVAKAGISPV